MRTKPLQRETTALMRLTLAIAKKVGVDGAECAEVEALAVETKSDKVLEEIVQAEKKHGRD